MARRRKADLDENIPKPKLSKESWNQAKEAFAFIKPYQWSFWFGLVLLFISSAVFMLFPYLTGLMVDIAQGEPKHGLTLNKIGLMIIGVLFVQGFVSYFRVMLFARVSENGIADIRKSLYQKLISLPITFFEENKTGELVSRATADVEKLYSVFSIGLAEFLRQLFILVVGLFVLFILAPKLSLIMLVTIPIVMVLAIIFGRYIGRLSKKRQKILSESNGMLSETISAVQIVKAFASERFETMRYNRSMDSVVKVSMKYAGGRAIFSTFIVTVLFGALLFIIWQGAVMVQNGDDGMTVGTLLTFVTYTFIIGASIAGLGNFYTEIIGALGGTERIREILNMKGEIDLEVKPDIKPMDIYGDIRFENVQFRYPTRQDIPILKGLNIDIKSGQKVALVGSSGAGKSTIIQLLLRFYEIEGGDILVDEKSIYDLDIRDLRNNMALVPQEVILFGGTIRENILYGKEDATEEEILAATKQSNSWEFIQNFPEGLETLIGERGVKLSGGQRQRIAIARAILKNPAILLLDEATSALDSESEKVVQDALDNLMEGRTSIIIAHRLTTIRDVDCIYVMDDGRVLEKGTHEELLLLENGQYRNQAMIGGVVES